MTPTIDIKNIKRDFRFDNLRGFAIICVVFVHLIESLNFGTYGFIRHGCITFTISILFFVSGYFSKPNYKGQISAFKNIFIPYMIFDTIWIIFTFLLRGTTPEFPYIVPGWGLWYLVALFLMRAFLPALSKIKHVFWISLIVAALVGVFSFKENFFVWYGTFYYLPVFLLGFYFT